MNGEESYKKDTFQLVQEEKKKRRIINRQHMLNGVLIVDPETTYITSEVTIGEGTLIAPNTHLQGETHIGCGCIIGPGAMIIDAKIGDRCRVVWSTIDESILEEGVDVGPYSHLRPGTHLCTGVHIGNYAEVKNSRLGSGVQMGHFSYIGDSVVGERTNVGAGTITCNYDGEKKHKTIIGNDVFLGSGTKLVAPITIGDGARTGAGSVVTKDVPAGALAVGSPARIMREQA